MRNLPLLRSLSSATQRSTVASADTDITGPVTIQVLQVSLHALSNDIRTALQELSLELREELKETVSNGALSRHHPQRLPEVGLFRNRGDAHQSKACSSNDSTPNARPSMQLATDTSTSWHPPRRRQRSNWARKKESEEDHLSGDEWEALLDNHLHPQTQVARALAAEGAREREQNPIQRLVRSQSFDFMACLLVASNAVLLGVETDYAARNVGELQTSTFFENADLVFTILFTLELVLRLITDGCRFFCHPTDYYWNIFDFLVVSLQLVDTFSGFLVPEGGDDGTAGSTVRQAGLSSLGVLRLVRIVRLFRIARVLRMLHLVDDLRRMVRSIVVSFKSLVWALLLIVILIYMIGVCVTQVVTEHREGLAQLLVTEGIQAMPKQMSSLAPGMSDLQFLYGNMVSTILVLWECISGGLDWKEAMDPLITEISPWLAILFVGYIAFCVLAMMNVTTGILVDQVMEDARLNHDAMVSRRILDFFRTCSLNQHGEITWETFESKLCDDTLVSLFKLLQTDSTAARGIFKILDVNDTESIDPDELVAGWLRLKGPAKSLDLALFMHEMDRVNKHICSQLLHIERDLVKLAAPKDKEESSSHMGNSVFNHSKSYIQTSGLFGRLKSKGEDQMVDASPRSTSRREKPTLKRHRTFIHDEEEDSVDL